MNSCTLFIVLYFRSIKYAPKTMKVYGGGERSMSKSGMLQAVDETMMI